MGFWGHLLGFGVICLDLVVIFWRCEIICWGFGVIRWDFGIIRWVLGSFVGIWVVELGRKMGFGGI